MMRHLIRIVEAAIFGGETPINRAAAERVAEILGQHVHVGAASLQEMAELMRLLPRPATAIRLWRVLGINGQQEKALRAGQTVRLGDRAFQSWTKDADTLPRIAADVRSRTRAASVVIVEETVQPEQVVVDVMAFLDLLIRHDEFHGIDTYELRRYGRARAR